MKDRNVEILKEMCELQQKLDNTILEKHNVEFDDNKAYLALLDEVGELNHELKANWCWWKQTQKPVDQDKVLEELVDCWHFALSIYNHNKKAPLLEDEVKAGMIMRVNPRAYKKIVQALLSDCFKFLLGLMIELSEALGFSLEDIYAAYLEKNNVNYKRQENGY